MAATADVSCVMLTNFVSSIPERSWKRSLDVRGLKCNLTPEDLCKTLCEAIEAEIGSPCIFQSCKKKVSTISAEMIRSLEGDDVMTKTAVIYNTNNIPFFSYQLDIALKVVPPDQEQEEKVKPLPQNDVWHEAWCANCHEKIRGIRYHCATCRSFDLCGVCEELNSRTFQMHYWDHVFLALRRPCLPVLESKIVAPAPLSHTNFRQMAICPNCRYMEFPACQTHKLLMTEPSMEEGHARCAKCQNGTNTLEEYAICRKCKAAAYDLNWFLVSTLQGEKLFSSFKRSGIEGRFISHLLLHCPGCQIIEFPTTYSGGLCINNDNALWDPQNDTFFRTDNWRCRHFGDCEVTQMNIVTIPVVFHLKEANFLSKCIRRTPPLFVASTDPLLDEEETSSSGVESETNSIVKQSNFVLIPRSSLGGFFEGDAKDTREVAPPTPVLASQEQKENINVGSSKGDDALDLLPEYAELKELMREVELELIMRASGKVDVSDSIPADSGVSPPSTITDVVPQKAAAELAKVSPGNEQVVEVVSRMLSDYRAYFEDFAEPERKSFKNFQAWCDFISANSSKIEGMVVEDADIVTEMMAELPKPIITFSLFEPEDSFNAQQSEEDQFQFLYDLLQSLPQENKEALLLLVRMIRTMLDHSDRNFLTMPMCANVFAPYMLNRSDLDYKKAKRKTMKMGLKF